MLTFTVSQVTCPRTAVGTLAAVSADDVVSDRTFQNAHGLVKVAMGTADLSDGRLE